MLAVLYDIHGNLPALEAVLTDCEEAGADRYLLGGDYALFGPWPAETVDRLRELGAQWIRGNGERWTADRHEAPEAELIQRSIDFSRELLGEEAVVDLGRLPEETVMDGVRYCHASPISDVQTFMPEPSDDDVELLGGVEERTLVFGHSHIQFRREGPHGIDLINPGSVGMPWDEDPRAAYGLVHEDGRFEHRRVEYDHVGSAAAVRSRLGQWAETHAQRIEQARFDV